MPTGDNRMEADSVLSIMFEANMKHRQLRIINRHLKHFSGGAMCKEEDVRKSINSIAIIKFQEFEEAVDGNIVQCRCKNINEFLNKFLLKIVIFLCMNI